MSKPIDELPGYRERVPRPRPSVRAWYQEQAEAFGRSAAFYMARPRDYVDTGYTDARHAATFAALVLLLDRSGCESLEELETKIGGVQFHVVQAPDGSPVAAPCAISGCQYKAPIRVKNASGERQKPKFARGTLPPDLLPPVRKAPR